MVIGERIRQIRIHRGLTQGELVKDICSVTYISKVENGKAKPSYSFVLKIAERLEVDFEFLTNVDTEKAAKNIKQIYNTYKEQTKISEQDLSLLKLNALESHSTLTLIRIYHILISYFTTEDIDKADYYVKQAKKLISHDISSSVEEEYILYFESLSRYHYKKQHYTDAFFYADLIIKCLPPDAPILQKAKINFNLSLIRQNLDEDLQLARIYSKKALELFKEIGNIRGIGSALTNLAIQSHRNYLYEDALRYLDELDAFSKKHQATYFFSIVEYNYGRVYQHLEDYNKAFSHYFKSMNIDLKANDEKGTIYTLKSIIEMSIELKNWDDVQSYLDKAFRLTETYHLPYVHIELLQLKAQTFKVRGDFPAYEKELQQAVQFAQEGKYPLLIKKISVELANHYNDVRAYKMAAKYYKIVIDHT